MTCTERLPVGTMVTDDKGNIWRIMGNAPDDDGTPAYFVKSNKGQTKFNGHPLILPSCFIISVHKVA